MPDYDSIIRNSISRSAVKHVVQRNTFKSEGMAMSVMAGQYNRLKNMGIAPASIGFFVGNDNPLSTDIAHFLNTQEQLDRIHTILKEKWDGVFSSLMPYQPNDKYACKGLLTDGSHNWKDGPVNLNQILIRFQKEGETIHLLSIYPVAGTQKR